MEHALTEEGRASNEAGLEAFRTEDYAAAADAFERTLAVEPNNPDALFRLGMCHYMRERHEDAIPFLTRVIGLKPDVPELWFRLAGSLLVECDHDGAGRAYQRAAELAPDVPQYAHGLATWRSVTGDAAGALAGFRRAQMLQPGYAWACYSEGMTLAGMGRWGEAWDLMEARRFIGITAAPLDGIPIWDGRELDGATILLRTEQGLGDVIHMARYVPMVRERGGNVVLETRPELIRLLAGGADIVPVGEPLPLCDWQDSLMSLPGRFATMPDSVPWDGPYLTAEAADVAAWASRLADVPPPRVGLCWAGGTPPGPRPTTLRYAKRRDLTAEQMAPILAVPGLSWVSLMQGGTMPAGVWDQTAFLDDMADTAALIANLDLVVTVDTSIVHLAGALGVPVWMLDRFDHCWRWLPGREDSPWYPSLRIFRQAALGEWQPVLERCAAELTAWLAVRGGC